MRNGICPNCRCCNWESNPSSRNYGCAGMCELSEVHPPKLGDSVAYKCDKLGHVSYLRLTTQRPEPDRWEGSACGFCLREGVTDSVMERTGKVVR